MSKLTEPLVKNATPRSRAYKLADGNGLCLVVMPTGARYWRQRYRFAGKEKMISVGVYPEVSLREARKRSLQLRMGIAGGVDPTQESPATQARSPDLRVRG